MGDKKAPPPPSSFVHIKEPSGKRVKRSPGRRGQGRITFVKGEERVEIMPNLNLNMLYV